MAKGSIERRGENSWRLRVDLGYNPDGTRNRPTRTITIEDKALLRTTKKLQDYLDDQLANFKREVESSEYIKPSKMTLGEFIEKEWGPKYASKTDNLAPLTYRTYQLHIKNHISPVFGHKHIEDIKTIHLVTFINDLSKSGARKDKQKSSEVKLSPNTIAYIYRVLKNILQRATDWKVIKSNPMIGIKKPKIEQKEFNYYDEGEAKEIIKALYKEPRKWRTFILGSLIGGCRRGELIALEWHNVDFERGMFAVEKSISLTEKGQAIEKDPKNESSKRWVAMPDWFMEELRIHRAEWEQQKEFMGSKWLGGERQYVFHGGYGKPYYHSYPTEWWKRFIARHNLKSIRFHDLRHSAATLLIEAGVSMKAVQKRLGHSKEQTTSDIYVHVTKKLARETAEVFNKFDPKRNLVPNSSPTAKIIPFRPKHSAR